MPRYHCILGILPIYECAGLGSSWPEGVDYQPNQLFILPFGLDDKRMYLERPLGGNLQQPRYHASCVSRGQEALNHHRWKGQSYRDKQQGHVQLSICPSFTFTILSSSPLLFLHLFHLSHFTLNFLCKNLIVLKKVALQLVYINIMGPSFLAEEPI